jgi:hypothetical protein
VLKKRMAGALTVTVGLVSLATIGLAGPSSAAGCGKVFNGVEVDGGLASWTITCTNGTDAQITGTVKDTAADGKCAYIKAFANTGASKVPLAKACPKGTVTKFDWKVPGAVDIAAYLFTA